MGGLRVLFSSTFGYGHIFPMVPLARAFADAGHDVRWATSADSLALVTAAGLIGVAAGLSGSELAERVGKLQARAANLPGAERAAMMYPAMFGEALTPPMTADLLALAAEWEPDLLVHEQGELAAPIVAAALGIPNVCHSFGGAVPPSFVTEAGQRLAPLWREHDRDLPPYAGCFSTLFLDICPPGLTPVPTDHIPRLQPLRPVSYTGPELPELPAFLAQEARPLVYLTLGTVQYKSPALTAAVRSLSKLPVRLLVTVGPAGDPAALGEQPAHVIVTRYVPQTQALPHCSVVVSHAGSGTFLGAVALGLPQLCLPQAADQFRNSDAGLRCGAALVLRPEEVTDDAIAAAVVRLLGEDSFRASAERQAAAIGSMPSPREVVDVLTAIS